MSADLCDHIVSVHHAGLRTGLPRITELLATVVRVHGRGHSEQHDLARLFAGMRQDLERHLELEERVLFPTCRALEHGAARTALDEACSRCLNTSTRTPANRLRCCANSPTTTSPRVRCAARIARCSPGSGGPELDLHQHIHEENNLLFPRALTLAGTVGSRPQEAIMAKCGRARETPSRRPSGALPLCCQAWAAEQAWPWIRQPPSGGPADRPTARLQLDFDPSRSPRAQS